MRKRQTDQRQINQQSIHFMKGDYLGKTMAEPVQSIKKTKGSFFRRLVMGGVGIIIILISAMPLKQTVQQAKNNKKMLSEIQIVNQKAVDENLATQQELHQSQGDDYLTEVARRDYFYSKPGEIIFDINSSNDNEEKNGHEIRVNE